MTALQSAEGSPSALSYSYPPGCEQPPLCPVPVEALTEQYNFPLDPSPMAPPAPEGDAGAELQGSVLDTEMMETVDSQHGFVLVN